MAMTNFEKQQMQYLIFQKDIESLELQLKEMSKLFFQNEEKISNDLRQLHDKFNLEVNAIHTKIWESKEQMKQVYEVRPALDKIRKMGNGMSTDETISISNQDEVTDNGEILADSSKGSESKAPQESLEEGLVLEGEEISDHGIACRFIDVMPDESTKNISHQGQGINDDNTFEEGYNKSVKDTCQIISDPLERSSEPGHLAKRSTIDEFTKMNASNTRDDNQDQDNEPYRSSSFHMYALGIATDSTKSSRHGWAVTWMSVIFTFFQFFVLTTVVYEASRPTCISHGECRLGEYCDFSDNWRGMPRCVDCGRHESNETANCPAFLSDILDYSHPDYVEIDHTKVGYGLNLDSFNETQRDCLVQAHCDETDMDEYNCDFLRFNRIKWHFNQKIVFVFMAMLFAKLLCDDIQDAIAEEAYMTIGLKNGSLGPSRRMACEFLRMGLRARQLILPWYSTSAAIAIIITEPLTAQNMLLNLLTIEVILIADDMFATLVLPLLHQDSTDKLMKHVIEEGVKVSYIVSRFESIIATLVMAITIFQFDEVMHAYKFFFHPLRKNIYCGDIAHSLELFYFLVIPGCASVIHSIAFSFLKKSKNCTKRIMLGIGQFLIDLEAWSLSSLALQVALGATTIEEDIDILLPVLLLFNALYYIGHMLRVWFAWGPVVNIHEALYKE